MKKVRLLFLIVLSAVVLSITAYFTVSQESMDIRDEAEGSDNRMDGRFGGGFETNVAEKMKLKSILQWGNELKSIENVSDLKNKGFEILLTVGKIDSPLNPNNPNVGYTQGVPNHETFDMISQLTKEFPGNYWQIANEPDWYPFLSPDDYAVWYKAFSDEILKNDSTAKISIGGIAWARYNHPIKWGQKELVNDGYIQNLITDDPDNKDMYENAAWLILFRKYYKDRYGEYPQIDFWNIHPYAWSGVNAQERYLDSKENILFFRRYMEFIGDADKPLLATEFSWMGVKCSDFDDCNDKSQHQLDYMGKVIPWLATTSNVQKWFWFYGGEEAPWAGSNYTADIFYKDGKINNVGQFYLDLSNQYRDETNPVITSVEISHGSQESISFVVNSADNAGICEYYYSLGSEKGNDDILNWNFDLCIADKYEHTLDYFVYEGDDIYLNVKTKDFSGNESEIYSLIAFIKAEHNPNNMYIIDISPKNVGDGKVNMLDLAVVLNNWKWRKENRDEESDINGDDEVNMLDVAIIINNWTKKY